MEPAVRVKVCGITREEDAQVAASLGIDALGFLVGLDYESDDALAPGDAARLVTALPPFVTSVLVTHQSRPEPVATLCRIVRPRALQLHGDVDAECVASLRPAFPHLRIIATVHVDDASAVERARRVARHADALLLDTRTSTRLGGTGLVHDWSISRRIRDALHGTPMILAGGLTPANVGAAIALVRPYGVDVNTGVCLRPGTKSADLMRDFARAVRSAAAHATGFPSTS